MKYNNNNKVHNLNINKWFENKNIIIKNQYKKLKYRTLIFFTHLIKILKIVEKYE